MKKCRKTPVFGKFEIEKNFCILGSLVYIKVEKIKRNMRTTMFDVKLDEESKSQLRIRLPRKGNPENAENYQKIIKLLVEKNNAEKDLVY